MTTSREVESQRIQRGKERAEMQKLFVTGHLLPGADISSRHITDFLEKLGPVCGMNIFNGPHVKTPDSYDPETYLRLGNRQPEDVNGTVMWDDSGAQMYVFPNRGNWFTLDVYTCKRFDPEKVLRFVYDELDPHDDMEYSESTTELNSPWRRFGHPNIRILTPENTYQQKMDKLFDTDLEDKEQVVEAGQELEEYVNDAVSAGLGRRLWASYSPGERAQLRDLHSAYETVVDDQFMKSILEGRATSPDQYHFQPVYDRLARIEGNAIGKLDGERLMHIGTGWPGTAIGLFRQFGVPVTCVEMDPVVAQRSKEALEKLGMHGEDKLKVVNLDGTQVNPRGHKAVIISAMVPNKDKEDIISNTRHLAVGDYFDPLLVLRTPADHARSFFYQELGFDPTGGIFRDVVSSASRLQHDDPLRSYICRVREMSAVRRGEDHLIIAAKNRLHRV
jgi:S-adenosylmethionine/arginine decarboxylase-like enzyme